MGIKFQGTRVIKSIYATSRETFSRWQGNGTPIQQGMDDTMCQVVIIEGVVRFVHHLAFFLNPNSI